MRRRPNFGGLPSPIGYAASITGPDDVNGKLRDGFRVDVHMCVWLLVALNHCGKPVVVGTR